jgi:hypothetical protein
MADIMMDEGTQGVVVLVITALAVSTLAHAFIRRFLPACLVSTVVAPILFQVFAYWHSGYLDKFLLIALITTGICSLVISAAVGLPFALYRRRKNDRVS